MSKWKPWHRVGLLGAAALAVAGLAGCAMHHTEPHLLHAHSPDTCPSCGVPTSHGCVCVPDPHCAGYKTTVWRDLGEECRIAVTVDQPQAPQRRAPSAELPAPTGPSQRVERDEDDLAPVPPTEIPGLERSAPDNDAAPLPPPERIDTGRPPIDIEEQLFPDQGSWRSAPGPSASDPLSGPTSPGPLPVDEISPASFEAPEPAIAESNPVVPASLPARPAPVVVPSPGIERHDNGPAAMLRFVPGDE